MSSDEPKSWYAGWIDTIKDQSESVIGVCKKDIKEFVSSVAAETSTVFSAIAQETSSIYSKTVNMAKETLEKINDEIDAASFPKIPLLSSSLIKPEEPVIIFDSREKKDSNNLEFTLINFDDNTFEEFRNSFNLISKKPAISDLLADDEFRSNYSKIVPSRLNFQDFWLRYFFHYDVVCKVDKKEVSENQSEEITIADIPIEVAALVQPESSILEANSFEADDVLSFNMSDALSPQLGASDVAIEYEIPPSAPENSSVVDDLVLQQEDLSQVSASINLLPPKTLNDPESIDDLLADVAISDTIADEDWSDFE